MSVQHADRYAGRADTQADIQAAIQARVQLYGHEYSYAGTSTDGYRYSGSYTGTSTRFELHKQLYMYWPYRHEYSRICWWIHLRLLIVGAWQQRLAARDLSTRYLVAKRPLALQVIRMG